MPLLSIVIPTHRRPHLLRTALESALRQDGFQDYEVIVSDNSTDQGAEPIVAELKDPKVRYFNTGADLDIYASWNYAVERASGRYTFLFADDDAILPDGLCLIHQALVRYGMPDYLGLACGWYSRPSFKRIPANCVRFEEAWTREGTFSPTQLLNEYFAFERPSFSATYVLIDESIRATLRARELPVYLPVFPDYALQGAALALARTAAVMRIPTLLHGYAVESLGEHYCYPRQNIPWPAPAGEDRVFRCSPMVGYTFANGRLETMLRVQQAVTEASHHDIDASRFLGIYGSELLVEGTWRDITADAEQYVAYIRNLPEPGKSHLLAQLKSLLLQLLGVVEMRAWEKIQVGPEDWLRGEEAGFHDILQAAAQARRIARHRQERKDLLLLISHAAERGMTPGQLLDQNGGGARAPAQALSAK